jgi:hypothetical protein
MLKLPYNFSIMHLFVLSLYYFSKLSRHLIICSCICDDLFAKTKQVKDTPQILQIFLVV